MKSRSFVKRSRGCRSGSAAVIFIIIIVIALTLFVVQKTGILSGKPKDPNAEGIMPWEEWKARHAIEEEGMVDMPAPKEFITKPLALDVSLIYPEDKGPRGGIELAITQDSVMGLWSGSYHNARKNHVDVQAAGFIGKFYGDHTRDENGDENPSKHYFFCKGEFRLMETGESYVKFRAGDMYVRGWMDEGNMVIGKVFLTSNEKDFYEYRFRGKAREEKPDRL